MLKNDINMEGYVFLFSRLERNYLGQWEVAAYYKKSSCLLILTLQFYFLIIYLYKNLFYNKNILYFNKG